MLNFVLMRSAFCRGVGSTTGRETIAPCKVIQDSLKWILDSKLLIADSRHKILDSNR